MGKTHLGVGITLPKNSSHHIPKEYTSHASCSDSDSEYLPAKVSERNSKFAIKRKKTTNRFALEFLHQYHDTQLASPLLPHDPPLCPIKVKKHKEKRAKARQKRPKEVTHYRYLGSLVLHQFGLVLLAQADNKNLRTDVVALGISKHKGDESPPVWHHGIDLDTAMSISKKMSGAQLNKIPSQYWHDPVDISSRSPEDHCKRRVWTVQFVCVNQMIDTANSRDEKGLHPVDLFQYYFEFGQEDLTSNVDVTIILGNFSKSESIHPKLLCMKFGKMIKGTISDEEAHSMFSCLQHLSGKSGFEIRRRDGSAGVVSPQSDINLMAVLPHLHSAIPRKVWGTFILRTRFVYLIYYKRCVPGHVRKSEWTHVWYSPPHNGGKFKLPKSMIELFPCIGEFCYQKMLAVTIMEAVNNYLVHNKYLPIAVKETTNEMGLIKSAREIFQKDKNATMLDFVHAYNTLNDFNQITHVVGSHIDHFPGGQSFENRMCVVHKLLKGYGRGGGLFSDDYTWSIVDWKK